MQEGNAPAKNFVQLPFKFSPYRADKVVGTSREQVGLSMEKSKFHCDTPIAQGKTMAEPQETQQEKETRWAAQRAAHETQQKDYRAARARTRGRNWLVVGAIVIIAAVIAAAMLL
jgi:hypothetical protein